MLNFNEKIRKGKNEQDNQKNLESKINDKKSCNKKNRNQNETKN